MRSMFGGNSNLPPGCSMRDIEEAFGGEDEPSRWPIGHGLPLVLDAWDFAQFDEHNLAVVPPSVRQALRELLNELDEWYQEAQTAAANDIWLCVITHGRPTREFLNKGWLDR